MEREVMRLLELLAPEPSATRDRKPVPDIQQHRTPNGCILQASDAALSVTWYSEADDQDRVGELQIVLWRGVVSRRGSIKTGAPPVLIRQEVLNPLERPIEDAVWSSRDGTTYTTPDLAALWLRLLDEQIKSPT